MRTDASERLAKLLNVEKFDVGYETEMALEQAADEIELLRKRIAELEGNLRPHRALRKEQ